MSEAADVAVRAIGRVVHNIGLGVDLGQVPRLHGDRGGGASGTDGGMGPGDVRAAEGRPAAAAVPGAGAAGDAVSGGGGAGAGADAVGRNWRGGANWWWTRRGWGVPVVDTAAAGAAWAAG